MEESRKIVALEEGTAISSFGITLEELNDLMQNKKLELLRKWGGVQGLAAKLKGDLKNGLSTSEAETHFAERRRIFNDNTYPEPPHKSWFRMFYEALQDTTLRILSVAAIISLILGVVFPHDGDEGSGWVEGAAILVAVLIVATVTATNNYTKEGQFRSLNKISSDKKVKVLRGGEEIVVSIFDINTGDVVILDTGDQVPADGIFIMGYNLRVDESVMTGESDAQKKNDDNPWMLSGCQVAEGVGRMLVTAVGVNSEWGRTLSKLTTDHEDTPLQEKLDDMAKNIGKLGLGVAIVVFIILTIYWIVDLAQGKTWHWAELRNLVDFFIIAVTIVVVAVPEGLPLAVTISLAYSMKQMYYDKNLVRHLAACETMGGATNICSDKTGTLTENRMSVREGWIAGTEITNANRDSIKFKPKVFQVLTEGISVNSNAHVNYHPEKPAEYVGNKTECALLALLHDWGCDYRKIRKEVPVHKLFTFSSARKRMSSIVKSNGKFVLYTKGASEIVLDLCTHVFNTDGEVVPLRDDVRDRLKNKIEGMADQALRTLCLAYKEFDKEDTWENAPEKDLVCLGIVGIMDPLRKEVPSAVASCKRAGIFVRMVTGDNITTAKRIAKECGILTDGIAIEGPDFAKLSGEELDDLLPRLQVLARSSPTDKHTLVTRLIHNGEVVAVTGDGTNDAMALKAADVGLAMGISGTEVAKEASDIVILDDNFASIVKTVLWGRSVYDNIRKFLQFQLTVNVVALTVAFIGAVTGRGSPLRAVQLLWVNLIMDTMAALALGTERPTDNLLDRKPYGRNTPLISPIMLRNLLGQAVFQVTVLFFILYAGHLIWDVGQEGSVQHYTMLFNTFVLCQVFNEINSRKVNEEFNVFDEIWKNWLFGAIILVTVFFQAIIVEFGGNFTATTHLNAAQWFSCIGIAFISLPLGALIRLIPIPKSGAWCGRSTNRELLKENSMEME